MTTEEAQLKVIDFLWDRNCVAMMTDVIDMLDEGQTCGSRISMATFLQKIMEPMEERGEVEFFQSKVTPSVPGGVDVCGWYRIKQESVQ